MGAEGGVFNRLGLLGDDELLGRHILNDYLALLFFPLDLYIVGKDGLHDRHGLHTRLLRHHHFFFARRGWYFSNLDSLLADNLELLVRQQKGQFFFGQVLVGLGVDLFLLVPVDLDGSHLGQKRILEPVVHDGHAWVVTHKHPVGILRGLLCFLFVTRAIRLKAHHIVRLGKDSEQGRQRTVNSLSDLACNNLGATLYLVAKGITVVILNCLGPLLNGLGLDIANSVVNLGFNYRFEC